MICPRTSSAHSDHSLPPKWLTRIEPGLPDVLVTFTLTQPASRNHSQMLKKECRGANLGGFALLCWTARRATGGAKVLPFSAPAGPPLPPRPLLLALSGKGLQVAGTSLCWSLCPTSDISVAWAPPAGQHYIGVSAPQGGDGLYSDHLLVKKHLMLLS